MNLKNIFLIPLIASVARSIGGITVEESCNIVNFKAGSDIRTGVNDDFLSRPVFNTFEEASRCYKGGDVLIGAEKTPAKIPPNLNKCKAESFRAGLRGKHSSRKDLANCPPTNVENTSELFPVEEDGQDKKCPIDLYKPCEGEVAAKYNPCYEKNIYAGGHTVQYQGNVIPIYDSADVAKKCLPFKSLYAVETENRYSIFALFEGAEDPTGCLITTLAAGVKDAYPSREALLKCPPTDDKNTSFRVGKDKKSSTFCTVDPNKQCVEERVPIRWG